MHSNDGFKYNSIKISPCHARINTNSATAPKEAGRLSDGLQAPIPAGNYRLGYPWRVKRSDENTEYHPAWRLIQQKGYVANAWR